MPPQPLPVRLYDAFAATPFGGNVAGVVLLPEPGFEARMLQRIAAELGAPTTGMVSRGTPGRFALRFFTPATEIDMCGHVVVGAGAALLDDGWASEGDRVVFDTAAGPIPAELSGAAVTMTQRTPHHETADAAPGAAAAALGLTPGDLAAALPIEVASTALRHLVLPVRDAGALDRAAPDAAALAALCRRFRCDTAPLVFFEPPGAEVAWRLRDFCPAIGNPEEAASGTTNGALGCYAVRHGLCGAGRAERFEAVGEQGVAMGRPSRIRVALACDARTVREVKVSGAAFRTLHGELAI